MGEERISIRAERNRARRAAANGTFVHGRG